MKVFSIISLLSLAIFGLAGCSGTATVNVNTPANANAKPANSTNSAMNSNMSNSNMSSNANMSNSTSSKDDDFMKKAAQGGMAEVELGKLAASKGTSADVKKFGQQMVTDHTKANDELKALAKKKNMTLPADLGDYKETMDDLSKLSGAEFDKEYVDNMVEDHEDDVKEFQKQAESGTDPDVKAFATKTLPTLQTHLKMIQDIKSKMK